MNENKPSTQNELLAGILQELTAIRQMLQDQDTRLESPNYKRPIQVYPTFDWSSIDAEVQTVNDKGEALTVVWDRKLYTKRTKNDDVWFSSGTQDNGYSRLITFKEMKGNLPMVTETRDPKGPPVTTPPEDDFSDLFPEDETPVTPPPVANGSHSQAMQDLLEWTDKQLYDELHSMIPDCLRSGLINTTEANFFASLKDKEPLAAAVVKLLTLKGKRK